jgi:hypothetical protein
MNKILRSSSQKRWFLGQTFRKLHVCNTSAKQSRYTKPLGLEPILYEKYKKKNSVAHGTKSFGIFGWGFVINMALKEMLTCMR